MEEAVSKVQTGQITYAVRDTRLDDKEIHEGDIMGIGDKGILAVGKDKEQVAQDTIEAMMTENAEVISILLRRRRIRGKGRRTCCCC